MPIRVIQTDDPLADPQVVELLGTLAAGELTAAGEGKLDVPGIVRDIIAQVQARGDEAVVELTEKVDKISMSLDEIRVPADQIRAAQAAADKDFLALARRAAENIREYQEHIKHRAPAELQRGGRRLGVRYTPVDRAGIYVPGWKAIYPSSVLMAVVPAQVAGVEQIAIAGPPTATGVNEMTLALAGELGIDEVYRVGGAIAMAAFAIGTERIPAVQMIAGPGNAFVAEAKQQLCGRVSIDSVAGASEVLVIADDTADPAWVAADLLAQAEHNPGSAVLATPSARLAEMVSEQVEAQLAKLERAEETRYVIDAYSVIIVTRDLASACEVSNAFAPEHLQISTADDDATLAMIRHAGAAFLGGHTPVPVGDYCAGPSHVLPTRGTAKYFDALSVNSFLTSSSILRYDAESLASDAADIIDFATREGLTAHAAAVRVRQHGSRDPGTGNRKHES